MKEKEIRGIIEDYEDIYSLKVRFHPNHTIYFSTEEEPQLAITEINTYEGWRAELYKPIRESREFERQRNQTVAIRNMNKEKTTKVQLNKKNWVS